VEDYFQWDSQAVFVGLLNRKRRKRTAMGREDGGKKRRALNEARCKKLGLL